MAANVRPMISAARKAFDVGVVGGPTVVIDFAGLRFVSDPTFDVPQQFGSLRKVRGPAVDAAALGDIDVVLLSHDDHADNLDDAGRSFLSRAPLTLTSPSAARRLAGNTVGLAPWQEHVLESGVRVIAVPAQHGPTDGERTRDGFINADVIGFVLADKDGAVLYISGDNASLRVVTEVHDRVGQIDVAVLHAGAASVPGKFGGRPLSLSSERAAAAAEILDAQRVVVVHDDGWAHFTEGAADVRAAFDRAGISDVLVEAPLGCWNFDPEAVSSASRQ